MEPEAGEFNSQLCFQREEPDGVALGKLPSSWMPPEERTLFSENPGKDHDKNRLDGTGGKVRLRRKHWAKNI